MFIDAIVGDTWDRMVYLFRVNPLLLAGVGAVLMVDSVSIAPTFSDPAQAVKLMRLVAPTLVGHVTKPWRLLGPVRSILRTRSSRYALDELKTLGGRADPLRDVAGRLATESRMFSHPSELRALISTAVTRESEDFDERAALEAARAVEPHDKDHNRADDQHRRL